MALDRALTRHGLEVIAGKFRALGDPTRLSIVQALMRGEMSVNEIVAVTGATQPNVSRHLGLLLRAGLVARRKAWPNSLYAIADPAVYTICKAMCESAEREASAIFDDA